MTREADNHGQLVDQGGRHDLLDQMRSGGLSRRELLERAGAAGLDAAILAACGATSTQSSPKSSSGPSGPSGTMRIALPFGTSNSLNPLPTPGVDGTFRNNSVFSYLWGYDSAGQLRSYLVDEAEPNSDASSWTIRLKSGVTFHDGTPLTADDVIYTIRQVLDPKTQAEGSALLAMVDGKNLSKVDKLTLRVPLLYPFSIFPYQFTYVVPIVKNGATSFNPPIGTGAFTFVSSNSQKIVMKRYPHYFEPGLPKLEGVELINIQDATARLDALKTGQVDAIYPADATQVAAAASDSSLQISFNKTGTYMPIYMNATKPPFSNPQVRQALQLVADRTKMNELAYDGQGLAGNDMFGRLDPGYPRDVPQRTYDPERAKSLFDQAAGAGTKLTFWTADTLPGQQTAALVFAQQAQAAGINIQVETVPASEYFSKAYAVQPFANDYWQAIPVLTNFSEAFLPDAIFSKAAAWSDPTATKLYKQAAAETDAAKRNQLVSELLVLFRDKGPYIVWAFEASPNIYSARVGGGVPNATGSLNGSQLERFYIKS